MSNSEYLKQLNDFEAHYDYDVGYLRELLEHSPEGFAKFNAFMPLARHREQLSLEEFWIAKLASMQVEDCGACLQLNIRMALEEGVDKALVAAAIHGGKQLPANLKAIYQFSRAIAANEAVDEQQQLAIEQQLDKGQRLELGLAIASTKIFPTLKRTLGEATSCRLMDIAV